MCVWMCVYLNNQWDIPQVKGKYVYPYSFVCMWASFFSSLQANIRSQDSNIEQMQSNVSLLFKTYVDFIP